MSSKCWLSVGRHLLTTITHFVSCKVISVFQWLKSHTCDNGLIGSGGLIGIFYSRNLLFIEQFYTNFCSMKVWLLLNILFSGIVSYWVIFCFPCARFQVFGVAVLSIWSFSLYRVTKGQGSMERPWEAPPRLSPSLALTVPLLRVFADSWLCLSDIPLLSNTFFTTFTFAFRHCLAPGE